MVQLRMWRLKQEKARFHASKTQRETVRQTNDKSGQPIYDSDQETSRDRILESQFYPVTRSRTQASLVQRRRRKSKARGKSKDED